MEFKEVAFKRTSIRNFTADNVPVDDLQEMVKLAGTAPSVNNSQPWKFYAVTNKDLMNRMADAISAKISELPENQSRISGHVKQQTEWFATFFKDAPAVIALATSGYESVLEKGVNLNHEKINELRNHPDIQSIGAAVQNILLAAVDMGYGACWMSAPAMAADEIDHILSVDSNYHVAAFVAVGKPQADKEPKNKKPLGEIFELKD